jgi:hypothetical protein
MAKPKEQVKHEQPQPLDLETSERLGTSARAIAQGIGHTVKGGLHHAERRTRDGRC